MAVGGNAQPTQIIDIYSLDCPKPSISIKSLKYLNISIDDSDEGERVNIKNTEHRTQVCNFVCY